jgi:hypothetical protein
VLKGVYRLLINLVFVISVSGIFLGAINITAPNGELVFPQVQLDYAGHYNLTVFTSNGADTAAYRLIVYGEFRNFIKKFSCTWKTKVFIGFTVN